MIHHLETRARLPCSIGALALALGCGGDKGADAHGNFEATEVVVAAEVTGQVSRFGVKEGDRLAAGQDVGLIDTTEWELERAEFQAERAATQARTAEVRAQVDVLAAERQHARRELDRTRRLAADTAATAQQLDRAENAVKVLDRRIQSIRTQADTVEAGVATIDARLAQIEHRIREGRLVSPVAGTVLTTFVAAHEVVQAGRPIYKLADLDTMTFRAYVGGDQLARVRIGQAVDVLVDRSDQTLRAFRGTVARIASRAEFTPTPIQTRDERALLVYAVEVRVPNREGILKIGMPGELRLAPEHPARADTRRSPPGGAP